jgi:nitrate reductase NapD
MDIASLIVRTHPDRISKVRDGLLAIPGVAVHAGDPDGRLVVTVEDGAGYRVEDSITELHRLDGVMSVSLVYKYSDDGLETQEVDHGNEQA